MLLARELVLTAAPVERPFTRTGQLAEAIREILHFAVTPGGGRRKPMTTPVRRVFQALRIAVNDEFGVLDLFLRQLPSCLKPGGRVAILTFHSGEDHRVKHTFGSKACATVFISATSDEVVRAGPEEGPRQPAQFLGQTPLGGADSK